MHSETSSDLVTAMLSGASSDNYLRGLVSAKLGPTVAPDDELMELLAGNSMFRQICDDLVGESDANRLQKNSTNQFKKSSRDSSRFSKEVKQDLWVKITSDPRFDIALKEVVGEWNAPVVEQPETLLSKVLRWIVPFVKKPEQDDKASKRLLGVLLATLVSGVIVGGSATRIVETSQPVTSTSSDRAIATATASITAFEEKDEELVATLRDLVSKLPQVVNVQPAAQDYDLLKQQNLSLQSQITKLEQLVNNQLAPAADNKKELQQICWQLDSLRSAFGGASLPKDKGCNGEPGVTTKPSSFPVTVTDLSTSLTQIIGILKAAAQDNKTAYNDISAAMNRPALEKNIPLDVGSTLKLEYRVKNDGEPACTAKLTLVSVGSREASFKITDLSSCTPDSISKGDQIKVGTGSKPISFQISSPMDDQTKKTDNKKSAAANDTTLTENTEKEKKSDSRFTAGANGASTLEVQISLEREGGKGNAPISWFRTPQSGVFRISGPRGWTAVVE